MSTYFAGLTISLLGFLFFQFSGLFNLYMRVSEIENTIPWPYLILRGIGYLLLGLGVFTLALGLIK